MARSIGAMGWRPARRNVVALFPRMKDARAAIDALEAHGIDAGAISLEGPQAVRAAQREDTRRRDAGVAGTVASRVIAGAAIGAAVGLGTAVIVVAFTAGAELIAMLIAALAGIVGGGSIGMMIAGVGTLDVTPDWELTFERDSAEHIVVAVGSEDRQQVQEAADVLNDLHPISVQQVDAGGRPV